MDDLIDVCAGKRFKVKMTPEVAKKFKQADPKQRARCLKWMEFFAEDGQDNLDKEKLRHEGKFSTGEKSGTKVAILAFKAWQLRVYGGLVNGDTFIATEIDTAKKQDGADQHLLSLAAKKLAGYL
ncbi:hypothetical protein DTW90_11995 [Neorhizobium sp. P12A]|uniref:hypothetical protein n=1 Tax=Neorhizobium sp. P12A TaxID=2268027 RepID=UPI0011EEB139|nr:hypothetical protein [Neorhizobium sp. P12A]KAA0698522.1 hypothetical protein DTW90_11995 [Neorhizobium sp. P12A]